MNQVCATIRKRPIGESEAFFYIVLSFQEALLIMQIKCVLRLTAPWVRNAPITRYSATIWCLPIGTFGYVNENDHIREASFWQGELRLLLYRDSLVEPITVNVISMGLQEIVRLETHVSQFWRCLRRGLVNF